MALPVGLWLLFLFVAAVWFHSTHLTEESVRANEVWRWVNGVGIVAPLIVAMQIVTGSLLAGHLVLEDPTVGTTAFWATRPMAGRRLLLAKICAGTLLLVIGPTLVMTPIWMASGFSWSELGLAAGEFAAWQAVFLVVALGLASLSESLAQFFFAAAGVALGFALCLSPLLPTLWGTDLSSRVETSRMWLIALLPVPFMAFLLVLRYWSRRSSPGWVSVGGGLLALGALRVFWPYDFTSLLPSAKRNFWPAEFEKEDRAVGISARKIVEPADRGLPHALFLDIANGPVKDWLLAPEYGEGDLRWAGGRSEHFQFDRGGLWGTDAAQRLAGLKPDAGPVEWDMAARLSATRGVAPSLTPGFSGHLQLMRMHGRVLAELPARAGGEAHTGSSDVRVVGFGEGAGVWRPCIIVEERDSIFVRDVGFTNGRYSRNYDESRQDCFLLVNRARGIVKGLHIVDVGSVNMDSMRVSVRQLEFSAPWQTVDHKRAEVGGWLEGAVLIKVRFESEHFVSRPVTTGRVALEAEEGKP